MSILENKFVVSTGITVVVVILFQVLLSALKIPWWPSIPIGFVTALFLHLILSRIQDGETEKGLALIIPGLAAIFGTAVSFGFVAWVMSHVVFTNIPKTQADWDRIMQTRNAPTQLDLPSDILCANGEPGIISVDNDKRYGVLTVTYRTSKGDVAVKTYRVGGLTSPESYILQNSCNR